MAVSPADKYMAIMTRVNSLIQLAQLGDEAGVADGWDKLSDSVLLAVTK